MNVQDLRTNAQAGSVVAQGALGILYLEGHEAPQDYAEAFRWLSAAATQGASRPAAWLGRMHEEGLGIPVDIQRAKHLYEFAAERGEFFGFVFLARLPGSGVLGTADIGAARQWYQRVLDSDVEECPEFTEAREYLHAHPA